MVCHGEIPLSDDVHAYQYVPTGKTALCHADAGKHNILGQSNVYQVSLGLFGATVYALNLGDTGGDESAIIDYLLRDY